MLPVPELLTYMQRLELLSFFAGYALLFTLVNLGSKIRLFRAAGRLLPAAYALVATIFLVRQVLYSNDPSTLRIIALRVWGCLAILFWFPSLQKRIFFSFVHSLPFFGLIVLDILTGLSTASGRDQIVNDMKMLTDSFLLNGASFAIMIAAGFIRSCMGRSFNR